MVEPKNSKEKRNKEIKNGKLPPKGYEPLYLIIWADSILFNACRADILDANNKLTKAILEGLKEYQ